MNEEDLKNIEPPSKSKEATTSQKRRNTAFMTIFSSIFILFFGIAFSFLLIFVVIKLLEKIPAFAEMSSGPVVFICVAAGIATTLKLNKLLTKFLIIKLKLQNKLTSEFVQRYAPDSI